MMPKSLKYSILIILLLSFVSLGGCERSRLLTVFKIDIQQGNAVEPEQVDQLQIGMTKEQVEFLLGTPLIIDAFHPDRWDYVYFLLPGFGERERRHLTVLFDADNVAEIIRHQVPDAEPEEAAEETPQEDEEA